MNLKAFSERHPLAFSILAVAVFTALTEIPLKGILEPRLGARYADYAQGMLEQYPATLGVILLALLAGVRPGSGLGFTGPKPRASVLLGWPLLLFALINAPDFVFTGKLPAAAFSIMPVILFFLYLSTGFIEETLFRGLVSGVLRRAWAKDKKGLYAAVLMSSFVFGLTHLANLFQHRYTPLASLTQILFAIFFGVFFEALRLRTGSLYPGILLHALVDFAGNLGQLTLEAPPNARVVSRTPMEALVAIAITIPLFLIGFFYLRKEEPAGQSALCRRDSRP